MSKPIFINLMKILRLFYSIEQYENNIEFHIILLCF